MPGVAGMALEFGIFDHVDRHDQPLGAKGAGEGGIIPVGGVIANAVANALGVEPNVLPLSPPRVWALIQEARAPARRP